MTSSSPKDAWSNDDLPHPTGPATTMTWPGFTLQQASRTAGCAWGQATVASCALSKCSSTGTGTCGNQNFTARSC